MVTKSPPTLSLKVNEIYLSLQGESTYAGVPCVFVRLTGCPLRCAWCDTAYAFYNGEDMDLEKVVEKVKAYGVPTVELTGGEPLAQEGAFLLLERLVEEGFQVLLETSGAVGIARVPKPVVKILDIKCPGSGEEGRNLWENLNYLVQGQDEIKFVLKDRADYDYAKAVIAQRRLAGRFTLLFSAVYKSLAPQELAEWIIADRLPVKFQLQMHKIIWPGETKGR
jgi:7-carboxy-7-deazaguanine synthase